MGDVERAMAIGVPPLEFDNLLETEIADQVEQVMRDDERRRGAGLAPGLTRNGAQRLAMQVIEVRVRYQDDIHRRQIAQVYSGLAQALQDEEPTREIGIDDYVLSANLEEKAGVSDESYAKLAVRNQLRFVGLAGARRHYGMSHQARELAGTLAQSGIFQRGL